MGADVKFGLTSNLTLDATINPDFGQVEADPAQLNLTAFETFFEERRPFFLEGRSIFLFGADPEQLFYSRRIGRAPQLTGLAPEGVDVPGASRILGAGKLTGRVAGGTSLGVLAAMTDRTTAGGTTIEPRTTFGLARAMRDLRGGESAIGVMVTAVDRELDAREAPYLRRAAYAGGIDGRHRFGDGRFEVTGSVAASSVRGSAEAIARTQRSSVHQFQRPDDALIVDTTRTSLDGTSFRVVAKKVAGVVRGTASYQRTSAGHETNDFGFLARADEQVLNTNLRFIPTKPIGAWRNASPSSTASTASRRRDFARARCTRPTSAAAEKRCVRERGLVGGERGRGVLRSVRARWAGAAGLADLQHAGEPRGRSEAPRVAAARGDLHRRRRRTLAPLARAALRHRAAVDAAGDRARHTLSAQPRQHAVDRQRRRRWARTPRTTCSRIWTRIS